MLDIDALREYAQRDASAEAEAATLKAAPAYESLVNPARTGANWGPTLGPIGGPDYPAMTH